MTESPHPVHLAAVRAFVSERLRIRERRERGDPPPWTTDRVLSRNHFTNVHREHDPGTQWVLREYLQPADRPRDERIWNVMLYRLVGSERTARMWGWLRTGDAWDPDAWEHAMREAASRYGAPFSQAYMVTSYHQMNGRDKISNVKQLTINLHCNGEWRRLMADLDACWTRQEWHARLAKVYGWGGFLAFQVLVDLCYDARDPLRAWRVPDAGLLPWSNYDDWAFAGPGTLRGLRALWPGLTQRDADDALAWLERTHADEPEWAHWRVGPALAPISRANWANVMCEYSKLLKIRAGKGGRIYRPRAGEQEGFL